MSSCDDPDTPPMVGNWTFKNADISASFAIVKSDEYQLNNIVVNGDDWEYFELRGVSGSSIEAIIIRKEINEVPGIGFFGCHHSSNEIKIDSLVHYKTLTEYKWYYNQVINRY